MTSTQIMVPSNAAQAETRQQFARWLQNRNASGVDIALPSLIRLSGVPISVSSAYRVAARAGLRGRRRNSTRYGAFWLRVNWDLPDRILTRIWGVSRQTLRQRRLLTGIGAAKLAERGSPLSQASRKAIKKEWRKAERFSGQRPH